MIKQEVLKQRLKELFQSQSLAVLSTHNKGRPYANLIAFAADDDLKYIYFATTRSTRKFVNISLDSRVAFLIDSRSNQEIDFHDAIAVTATGSAIECSGKDLERLRLFYLKKHPHLEDFIQSPTCALIQVAIDCYYFVERFQNVTELHMKK